MRFSARNQIKGTVKKVTHGVVNSEVVVELPGGSQVVAIITKKSAQKLDLQDGKQAYVIIKASDVMIGVD